MSLVQGNQEQSTQHAPPSYSELFNGLPSYGSKSATQPSHLQIPVQHTPSSPPYSLLQKPTPPIVQTQPQSTVPHGAQPQPPIAFQVLRAGPPDSGLNKLDLTYCLVVCLVVLFVCATPLSLLCTLPGIYYSCEVGPSIICYI